MPVYFLSTNNDPDQFRDLEVRLRAAIPDLVKIGNLSEIVANVRGNAGNPVYILFAAPASDRKYVDNLIGIAARHGQSIFLILISDDISTNDYKRLVQTGGADWVSTAGAPQEILDILAKKRLASAQAESAAGPEPIAITFAPSAGGVGNSKLASEVGVRLKTGKATRGRRVCLIDLDLQTSHVCAYLDIEPKFRVEEIAKNPERLDAQLFEIFKSRHSSGLDVIAAPRSKFNLNDLSVDALDVLFDMASTQYDLILIDLPVTWFSWTFDIVANSDAVVVTGINTIPCLHQIVDTLAAVRANRVDAVPMAVVINRCERGFFGGITRRRHVDRVLGRETIFFIHEHQAAMVDSVNTGTALASGYGARKITKEIEPLVRYCASAKSLRKQTTAG